MGRSLNALLSQHEEVALRRVALGLAPQEVLSDRAIARLKSLALIEVSESGLRLTQIGRQRYAALPAYRPPRVPSHGSRSCRPTRQAASTTRRTRPEGRVARDGGV
jgi:hypothetical protein